MTLTLDEPMATMRLASKNLDPQLVSQILNVAPTAAAKEGERLYKTVKSNAIARTGTWFFTTEGDHDLPAAAHLRKVLALLSPHIGRLKEIMPDLSISLSLLVVGKSGADISAELRRQAESFGRLEIQVLDPA